MDVVFSMFAKKSVEVPMVIFLLKTDENVLLASPSLLLKYLAKHEASHAIEKNRVSQPPSCGRAISLLKHVHTYSPSGTVAQISQ